MSQWWVIPGIIGMIVGIRLFQRFVKDWRPWVRNGSLVLAGIYSILIGQWALVLCMVSYYVILTWPEEATHEPTEDDIEAEIDEEIANVQEESDQECPPLLDPESRTPECSQLPDVHSDSSVHLRILVKTKQHPR